MGRRPNALILEFFHRGQKLEDQSNRYLHTCKKCAQVFPKGRPDSLYRHLFEKCPNITEDDRQRALTRASEPDFQTGLSQFSNDSNQAPLSIQREPSALDTLAEVSRHHLDLSRQGTQPNPAVPNPVQPHDTNNELDGWFAQLSQQLAESNSETQQSQARSGAESGTLLHYALEANREAHESPLVNTASAANDLHIDLSQHNTPPNSHDGMSVSDQIALAEHANNHQMSNAHLDPQLQPTTIGASLSTAFTHDTATSNQAQQIQNVNHDSGSQPYPTAMRGYGLLQRPLKKQARSRFTEERRKQVGGIRKMGACLRCRMLKKPCSGETPCATCRHIESARLWTNRCIRTRVADEFSLYNTALFYGKAHQKVHLALSEKRLEKPSGRIEATIFPEYNVRVSFRPMVAKTGNAAQLDPLIASIGVPELDKTIFLIDFEADDMTSKVERYLVDETDRFIARESSSFIRETLTTATGLIRDTGDILLAKTINLWTATNVLARFDEPIFTITYNPNANPADEPEMVEPGPHAISPERRDYELITAQLLDATERYCATQGKAVMAELERRLLARQQTAAFVTFLVSVILFNCAERMSLLYRSFDKPDATSETQPQISELLPSTSEMQGQTDESQPSTLGLQVHSFEPQTDTLGMQPDDQVVEEVVTDPPFMPVDWPLEAPPSALWIQGRSFTDLVALLLRIRALPPRTAVRQDGTLAVLIGSKMQPMEVPADGSHTDDIDPQHVLAAQWLLRTGVTAMELQMAKDTPDDTEAKPGAWDLRFVADLLLPEHFTQAYFSAPISTPIPHV